MLQTVNDTLIHFSHLLIHSFHELFYLNRKNDIKYGLRKWISIPHFHSIFLSVQYSKVFRLQMRQQKIIKEQAFLSALLVNEDPISDHRGKFDDQWMFRALSVKERELGQAIPLHNNMNTGTNEHIVTFLPPEQSKSMFLLPPFHMYCFQE